MATDWGMAFRSSARLSTTAMAYLSQDRPSPSPSRGYHFKRNVLAPDVQTHTMDRHDAKVRISRSSCCLLLTSNRFLSIAASHPFVMHSILAFSASHLAWISQSSETRNLAFHHAGIALKGLHENIANFTKVNSDAVLASSLLLAWQATDW